MKRKVITILTILIILISQQLFSDDSTEQRGNVARTEYMEGPLVLYDTQYSAILLRNDNASFLNQNFAIWNTNGKLEFIKFTGYSQNTSSLVSSYYSN